jgi:hypothetical protein
MKVAFHYLEVAFPQEYVASLDSPCDLAEYLSMLVEDP